MGFPGENSTMMRLEEQSLGVGVLRKKSFILQGGENKQGERSCKKKKSEEVAKESFKGKDELRSYV